MSTALGASRFGISLLGGLFVVLTVSCGQGRDTMVSPSTPLASSGPTAPAPITTDADLFALVTQTEPFLNYALFPNAEDVVTGTLNGSSAHAPLVRTSLNATARGALQDGRLMPGGTFPDGSVIFKEVRSSGGAVVTYAVMYKSPASRLAGNGWVWAEFSPGGSVGYTVMNRGAACTGCHSLELGRRNDSVRTFERQR